MSGTGSETLTAALRRLADERASGLLSIATPGPDVVLELADGLPVGIGPTHEVEDRVGRDAAPELVAAAVVDGLVDRTVAAIVGGGGAWTWDIQSDASLLPVPPGLAVELSRRAVDAAQALAELDPEIVLLPARQFDVTGEIGRMQALFDGERSLAEVAELAGITLPAGATNAAAMVRAGVLSSGMQDARPASWSDTVAGAAADEDEDEPEPWVMDPPEDPPVAEEPAVAEVAARSDGSDELEPVAITDEGWSDSTWLDDLDGATDDEPEFDDERDHQRRDDERSGDSRAALSAMLTELQGPEGTQPARSAPAPASTAATPTPAAAPEADDQDHPAPEQPAAGAQRRGPRAEPAEVAEFLRELSRLALDQD